jgi:hypothetical protein
MRKLATLILPALLAAAPAFADGVPTILKQSVLVQARRVPGPKDNVYTWLPKIQFLATGPIAGGGAFVADFGGGKSPWVSLVMKAPETAENDLAAVEGWDVPDAKKATTTGEMPLTIRYKNELTGVDQVVFTGKLDVKKVHPPGLVGAFKSTVEYYVDYDANLPLAFLWWDYKSDPQMPKLSISLWMRGAINSGADVAYVFYKGKQVSQTDNYEKGVLGAEWAVSTGNTSDCNWTFARLSFTNLRGAVDPARAGDGWLDLSKNPGDYEVKVMRAGKLTRTLKFTVGDDGKVVDNGLAAKAKLGGTAILLPVKLLVDSDGGGKIDKNAWKKGALLGNPPAGFTAP